MKVKIFIVKHEHYLQMDSLKGRLASALQTRVGVKTAMVEGWQVFTL